MASDTRQSPFRRAAEDAQRTQSFGGIILARPVPLTVLTIAAMIMAFGVILLLTFGSYTRRITVDGIVMPDTGLVKVYAQQPGVVLRKTVAEGQRVTRGTVLYTVSTDVHSATGGHTQLALIEQARQRKHSLLQEIDQTRLLQQRENDTLAAKVASVSTELERLDNQIASQRQRVSIAADSVTRYERLLAQDFISIDQFRQRQADHFDQKSQLFGLQRARADVSRALRETSDELAGLALKHQNQLSQISRAVIDVERMLIESEARRELAITAPETGVATAVIAEPGQTVDAVHPAASIVPDGARWVVYLFVPSVAAGFVQAGDSVRVRYKAYPYQKFGQHRALVTSVARTALSSAELIKSGMPATANTRGTDSTFYRLTALLDQQTVTAYGKPRPLQAGMALQADILQERRRLYEWVLEPLYSITGKL